MLFAADYQPPCTHPAVPIYATGVDRADTYDGRSYPYATILVSIDAEGNVTAVKVGDSSGDPGYDRAASDAMRKWKFMPAAQNCSPVPSSGEFAVGGGGAHFDDPCNHDAVVTHTWPVQFPLSQRTARRNSDASYRVSLDSRGVVKETSVTSSSGVEEYDNLGIDGARLSTYLPKVVNCTPVDSTYVFRVTFEPNG